MSPGCQEFRDQHLRASGEDAPQAGHVATCAACAAWAARVARQVEALAALPRHAAPFELDGLVVAALGAGARQERAARSVAALGRVRSPAELESAVDASLEDAVASTAAPQLRAPSVLDRLVSEELADPAKARVRRFLGSLSRRRAPDALRQRLARGLREGAAPARTSSRRQLAWVAAAAAVLVLGLGSLALRALRGATPDRARPEVLVLTSSEQLPGVAAGLLEGVLGGGLSAREL